MKAMKKALCLLLAAVMLFVITACSGSTNGTAPDAQATASAASGSVKPSLKALGMTSVPPDCFTDS